MPIYEYKCQSCSHELDALQKLSDKPLRGCPECGKPALKKKISASAFRLKGGGWYETDFKTGNKKNLHGVADSTSSAGNSGDKASPSSDKAGGSGDKASASGDKAGASSDKASKASSSGSKSSEKTA